MSDDFNATLAAITQSPEPEEEEEEGTLDHEEEPRNEEAGESNDALTSSGSSRARTKKSRTTKAAKKRESLALEKMGSIRDLMRSMNTMVYTELFILYYMDCSFFRLLMRSLGQVILFTPSSRGPLGNRIDRPYIRLIFIPNIACLLLHLLTARPSAGETSRGYLHGGIIMDLIGQKGPTSKLHLLLLDLLVLVLQCFLLAISVEYKALDEYVRNKGYKNEDVAGVVTGNMGRDSRGQDHDAEERGVFRVGGTTSDDIELQSISHPNPSTTATPALDAEEPTTEHSNLLTNPYFSDPQSRTHHETELQEWLDLHHSGIAITAEFHILHILKSQYRSYKNRADIMQEAGRASMGEFLARALETAEGAGNEER